MSNFARGSASAWIDVPAVDDEEGRNAEIFIQRSGRRIAAARSHDHPARRSVG